MERIVLLRLAAEPRDLRWFLFCRKSGQPEAVGDEHGPPAKAPRGGSPSSYRAWGRRGAAIWPGVSRRPVSLHSLSYRAGLWSGCASCLRPQRLWGVWEVKTGRGEQLLGGGLVWGDQRGRRTRGVGQGQKDLEGRSWEDGSGFGWRAADREEGKALGEREEKGKMCGLDHVLWSAFSLLQSCSSHCIFPVVPYFSDKNMLSLLRNRHYANNAFAEVHLVWCTCKSIYSHSIYMTVNEVHFLNCRSSALYTWLPWFLACMRLMPLWQKLWTLSQELCKST